MEVLYGGFVRGLGSSESRTPRAKPARRSVLNRFPARGRKLGDAEAATPGHGDLDRGDPAHGVEGGRHRFGLVSAMIGMHFGRGWRFPDDGIALRDKSRQGGRLVIRH